MVFAKAMVTDTFGAIAEFKVGIVRVCSSADCTLMVIKIGSLLAANLLRGTLEINGGRASFQPSEHAEKVFPAEDNKVQHCHNREKIGRERI